MLSIEDLIANHRCVFYHTARHEELGTTKSPVMGKALPSSGRSTNSQIRYNAVEKLWAATVEMDVLSLEFFSKKSTELADNGYCTLEGFGADTEIPHNILVPTVTRDGDVVHENSAVLREPFPGEERMKDPEFRKIWSPIFNFNEAVDEKDRGKGVGRFITMR